jgi:nucleotide-binding universal stress UspA family protein
MLDSLLIPLDGSEFSEHTLPYARAVARASGARVHLAHVHVPHPPEDLLLNPQFQFEGVDMGEYDQEYRSEEKDYLKDVASRFKDQTGVEVVGELLEGDVLESIQSYADRASTDLILMSTHGRTGLSRFWLGSVADDLVRNLTLPILLVPPGEDETEAAADPHFDHILVPLDGSPWGESILGPALDLGWKAGARFTLLHVVPTSRVVGARTYPVPMGHLEERRARAKEYLSGLAERLSAQNVEVECKVVDHSSPARAILVMADAADVDLIALATHGHRALTRAVLGSVADKVVRASSRPVLVQRPPMEGS